MPKCEQCGDDELLECDRYGKILCGVCSKRSEMEYVMTGSWVPANLHACAKWIEVYDFIQKSFAKVMGPDGEWSKWPSEIYCQSHIFDQLVKFDWIDADGMPTPNLTAICPHAERVKRMPFIAAAKRHRVEPCDFLDWRLATDGVADQWLADSEPDVIVET